MANLNNLLYQYLIEHSYLSLPGIGVLKFSCSPAQSDIVNKQILAPQKTILIEKADTSTSDKSFIISFLSKCLKIEMAEAENAFHAFIATVQSKLSTDKIYHWPGMGILKENHAGLINFLQDLPLNNYWSPVQAERVTRLGIEHSITVGNTETTNVAMKEYLAGQEKNVIRDYWWIWAIIILIVSAVLIYFQFKNQDFF